MTKKDKTENIEIDLANSITKDINKLSPIQLAYNFDDDDIPSVIKDFISTGCYNLDLILSNERNGGFPIGRYILFAGPAQAGKSLIVAHAMVETQKKGGIAVLIDSENRIELNYLKSLGMDTSSKNYIYVQTNIIETVYEIIEKICKNNIENGLKRPITILLDGVTGLRSKKTQEDNFDLSGYNTANAIMHSENLKKIVGNGLLSRANVSLIMTSQLRSNMDAMAFGDKYVIPGGWALKHYASAVVRLQKLGVIKSGDNKVGVYVQANTDMKNTICQPHRKCKFIVRYDSGIANIQSIIEMAKDYGVIKSVGAYMKYTSEKTHGEEITFQKNNLRPLLELGSEIIEEIKDKLFEKSYVPYKTVEETNLDEIEIVTEDEGDDE